MGEGDYKMGMKLVRHASLPGISFSWLTMEEDTTKIILSTN